MGRFLLRARLVPPAPDQRLALGQALILEADGWLTGIAIQAARQVARDDRRRAAQFGGHEGRALRSDDLLATAAGLGALSRERFSRLGQSVEAGGVRQEVEELLGLIRARSHPERLEVRHRATSGEMPQRLLREVEHAGEVADHLALHPADAVERPLAAEGVLAEEPEEGVAADLVGAVRRLEHVERHPPLIERTLQPRLRLRLLQVEGVCDRRLRTRLEKERGQPRPHDWKQVGSRMQCLICRIRCRRLSQPDRGLHQQLGLGLHRGTV